MLLSIKVNKFVLFLFFSALSLEALSQAGEVLSISTIAFEDIDSIPNTSLEFGHSVVSIGDLDQDGFEDIAVGAPVEGFSRVNRGAVYIVFLKANQKFDRFKKIKNGLNGFTGQTGTSGRFGAALSSLGDLDGDGTTELVVGNPFKSNARSRDGVVWILSLNALGEVVREVEIGEGLNGFQEFLQPEEYFGFSVSGIPDTDGDGIGDLVVGALGRGDANTSSSGRVYLLNLNSDGTVKNSSYYDNSSPFISNALNTNYRFGEAVSYTNDLDGNGIPEIVVGAPGDDIAYINAGSVWILFLDNNQNLQGVNRITKDSPNFSIAQDTTAKIGRSIANLGDIDGDGFDDLAIGSLTDSLYTDSTAAIRLLFLNSAGTIKMGSKLTSAAGPLFSPFLNAGIDFDSESLSVLYDVDGDGKRDLLVGSPRYNSKDGQIHLLTLDGISRISLPEEKPNQLSLSVYPNPSTGVFEVNFPAHWSGASCALSILDSKGAVVQQKTLTVIHGIQEKISLEMPSGAYYVQALCKGERATAQVFVAKK
jgi:hypothetical protein